MIYLESREGADIEAVQKLKCFSAISGQHIISGHTVCSPGALGRILNKSGNKLFFSAMISYLDKYPQVSLLCFFSGAADVIVCIYITQYFGNCRLCIFWGGGGGGG